MPENKPKSPRKSLSRQSFSQNSPETKTSIPIEDPEEEKYEFTMKNDENVEVFLRQIHELKELCKLQGLALANFQETMETTKEDNKRLENVLFELENEKKERSDLLFNSGVRSSGIFDYTSVSPVVARSFESSIFVSTLDGIEVDKDFLNTKHEKSSHSQHQVKFMELALVSHIYALKI